MAILGLHHVTATVDDAQEDVDFGAGALGLRLVKKTVNFDNNGVYHFYYGDEVGRPGTLWTTFPYRDQGVPMGAHGAGQITVTSFSVPARALGAWKRRLQAMGHRIADAPPRFGEESIVATDPSGLAIALVGTTADSRAPWLGAGVDADAAIRGLHSVSFVVHDPAATLRFMRDALGFEVVQEMEGRTRLAVGGDLPGRWMEVVHDPDAPRGRNGVGTVHHVAMAIATPEEQLALREELVARGVQVTPVRDRQYFRSIYFREPGGVLFEVATLQPGFAVDEPVEQLGRALKLPPWVESSRPEIEAALPPVSY